MCSRTTEQVELVGGRWAHHEMFHIRRKTLPGIHTFRSIAVGVIIN